MRTRTIVASIQTGMPCGTPWLPATQRRLRPRTGRFARVTFGTNALKESADWTLEYPTVEAYRDDWLKMAAKFRSLPLVTISHRELLYAMQSFAKIEIAEDRAVVWKQFYADEPLTGGERYRLAGQSVYRLHRNDGHWRIVGFVGYLPSEPAAA
jgi:hypothetical protein